MVSDGSKVREAALRAKAFEMGIPVEQIDQAVDVALGTADPIAALESIAPTKAVVEASELTVTVPVGRAPSSGYEGDQAKRGNVRMGVHVDAQLGAEEAELFLAIREGLRRSNAKLKCGRPVYSGVETLRWLLQNLT